MYWGGEGRKDLIAGLSDGRIMLFTNTGTDESPVFDAGVYLQVGPAGSKVDIDVGARACPTVADWDSDGRRDLVVGGYDGLIHLFLNTGTDELPDFEAQTYAQDSGVNLDVTSNRSSPHFEDLDNDGKKDLLVGNTNGELVFYSNTGTAGAPSFTGYEFIEADSVKIDLAGIPRSRPFVCDWNADGSKDVLIGAGDGLVYLYLGIDHQAGVDEDPTDDVLAIAHLFPPRPNPFSERSTIAFSLASESYVELTVYDAAGRHVASVARRAFPPGHHEAHWNGRTDEGDAVPAGVYLLALRAEGELHGGKLLLIR